MPLWAMLLLGFGGLLLTILGFSFAFYKVGVNNGVKKNGYVTAIACDKNVNGIKLNFKEMKTEVKNDFEKLHEKVNDTNIGISKLAGTVKAQHALTETLSAFVKEAINK